MKKTNRKLHLHRETLQQLDLQQAQGGATVDQQGPVRTIVLPTDACPVKTATGNCTR